MANFYILNKDIYLPTDTILLETLNGIEKKLILQGNSEIRSEYSIGSSTSEAIREAVSNSDIILLFVDENLARTHDFGTKISPFIDFTRSFRNKLFVPVYDKPQTVNYMYSLKSIVSLFMKENSNDTEIGELTENIIKSYQKLILKSRDKKEEEEEIKKRIDQYSGSFVTTTRKDLSSKERGLRSTAYFCYSLGLLAILFACWLVYSFASEGLHTLGTKDIKSVLQSTSVIEVTKNNASQNNWSLTIYFAIKSILIISLLIAASKYCFTLAKSFMIESLKIADRSHAIGFGQFYLEVFSHKSIEPDELKSVFSDWNINNSNSAFSNQETNHWDPKVMKNAIKLVSKIRDGKHIDTKKTLKKTAGKSEL